eukprot:341681_1
MGKSCSCLSSVPKDNLPINCQPKDDHVINQSDFANEFVVDYSQHSERETEHVIMSKSETQSVDLLVSGYIRDAMDGNNEYMKNTMDVCTIYYFREIPERRKRCIFISIVHLNLSIHCIPKYILNESIFCFKTNPQ